MLKKSFRGYLWPLSDTLSLDLESEKTTPSEEQTTLSPLKTLLLNRLQTLSPSSNDNLQIQMAVRTIQKIGLPLLKAIPDSTLSEGLRFLKSEIQGLEDAGILVGESETGKE